MDNKKLLRICMLDRKRSLESKKNSCFKKYLIDLILKAYILLINSFGAKNVLNNSTHLFIDEVKNVSMSNNLHKTKEAFEKNNVNTHLLCFYKLSGKEHVKIGYINDLVLMIKCTAYLVKSFVVICFKRNKIEETIMSVLIKIYKEYLKNISDKKMHAYLMSDHHFFSTITAVCFPGKSFILQHGLIMDKRFYYPIYADYFLAWGIKSRELLRNSKKVVITGTYKFRFISEANESINDFNKILFCISSLDNNKVQTKIDNLLELSSKSNRQLAVKCHPGSQFDIQYWKKLYSSTNVLFYQEELLENLDFDLAVVENSTVIIDLSALNKPFILYDSIEGYFQNYSDIIPYGRTREEIRECMERISDFDFDIINERLRKYELNNCKCEILSFDLNGFI